MKRVIILLFFAICCMATQCEEDILRPEFSFDDFDILTVGHFYGFCQGEECIEVFRFEKDANGIIKVLEDTQDNYPNQNDFYQGQFIEINQDFAINVNEIIPTLPKSLFSATNRVFGCPDCADQGGIYMEYLQGSNHFYWIFDQNKQSIPEEYHDLVDSINRLIADING